MLALRQSQVVLELTLLMLLVSHQVVILLRLVQVVALIQSQELHQVLPLSMAVLRLMLLLAVEVQISSSIVQLPKWVHL